jgi:hypothetical protein
VAAAVHTPDITRGPAEGRGKGTTMSTSNESPVLLTVRGTLAPSSQEAARTLHNETAGSAAGIAAARALGDLSHKVYVPASAAGKHAGAEANELLFIDVWADAAGIQQFFGDPRVGEQASKMFTARDPVVWMPARGAASFHLPAAMNKSERYVGIVRGAVRSPDEAIATFAKLVTGGLRDARRRGQLSHELFFRLAPPSESAAVELLGVDVWSDFAGMMEHYGQLSGMSGPFAGPPRTSVWAQPSGSWSEW